MSLILEALKKAERQHRLGQVPGIGSRPQSEVNSGSRWWMLLLLFAMAGAMLVFGIYLGRSKPEPPVSVAQPHPATPAETQSLHNSTPVQAEVPAAVEVLPPEKQLEPTPMEPVLSDESAEMLGQPVDSPSQISEPSEPIKPPPEAKQLSELPDGFVSHLPKLNIDIHSFDQRPGVSYVLINMQKYREGDYLAEGPLLSKILPDGVILEHMGERFVLPIGNY